MERFYLGSPEPSWLWRSAYLPLFVSHRRLARLVKLRRANVPWALDSGGFSEIGMYGEWRTTPREYVAAVARYDREIGVMGWAALQDWMCEPQMLAKTGLTVAEHQARTVDNFLQLRTLWPEYSDDSCPFEPSLQGDPESPEDYLRCIERYTAAGVDLRDPEQVDMVAIGSVCRQENTDLIERIVSAIVDALPDVPLHGFGVKSGGLRRVGHLLTSADSQAWSRAARHEPERRTQRCTHPGACSWCPHFALEWYQRALHAADLSHVQWQGHFPEHGEPDWRTRWRTRAAS
ncbi:hypothetical protein K1T35_47580 (plasmid) [Pseudonocardia sp. DSM 110487]|uniref:deazapurine DNA modification protein DpdA family protein n=1 Tax=Pseudonocardia sp. DSM 110487 TaxID=2865833 RepID=UPI001C6A187A|nr:hypothetical protein [Pseudonocardia sp. DSM 110487]QYN41012.1 hypothetical protein K1T35_47580 [Pseudonocardia sp. DSM 110487]